MESADRRSYRSLALPPLSAKLGACRLALWFLCSSALARSGGAIRWDPLDGGGQVTARLYARDAGSSSPVHAAPMTEEDICTQRVYGGVRRKSAWRRIDKCECAEEAFVVTCDVPDKCPEIGRYYKTKLDKRNCRCAENMCALVCGEVVIGAVRRVSARFKQEKCKCPEGLIITGQNQACHPIPPERKFNPAGLINKGCMCGLANATTPGRPPSTPDDKERTCRAAGCSQPYLPHEPCQCDKECRQWENCCSDYGAVCEDRALRANSGACRISFKAAFVAAASFAIAIR